MDTRALVALEEAMEPYQRAGFIVTSQSEGAITLVYPRPKFSYLLFLGLLLVWPFALLYLISFNNQRERSVCLRVTSQGQIEESGYTLKILRMERDRARRIDYCIVLPISIGLLAATLYVLYLALWG